MDNTSRLRVDNSKQKRDRNGKRLKKFYPMTDLVVDRILSLNLSAPELRLWLYCTKLDPFGDRFVELPPVPEVLATLKISIASFYRAKKRLQIEGLFHFKESIAICNVLGSKQIIQDNFITSDKIYNDSFISGDKDFIISDNDFISDDKELDNFISVDKTSNLEPLQEEVSRSPQIYNSDPIHTLSDPAHHPKQPKSEKNTNNENSQTANSTKNLPLSEEKEISSLDEKDVASIKITPPCSTVETRKTTTDPFWNNRGRNVQQRLNPRNNLAEGEWCIDGKLDPVFHEWFAKKWLEWFGDRYKGDIHAAKADVIAHFYNQPEKLPVRWLQYTQEFQQRYQNAQIVVKSGGYFDEDYENRLRENTRSLTKQLPPELNPVADKREIIQNAEILEGGNEPVLLNAAHDWKKNIPDAEIVDNVEAYRPYIPPKLPELPSDYKKGTLSELRKKLASKLSMPEAEIKDRDRQKN